MSESVRSGRPAAVGPFVFDFAQSTVKPRYPRKDCLTTGSLRATSAQMPKGKPNMQQGLSTASRK